MELRQYWKMFLRRWWLVVIPALVVLGFGLATYQAPTISYNVGMRFLVSQAPGEATTTLDEQRYYNWLGSEYVVNGLTDWVSSGLFAQAVSDHLAEQGVVVPAGAIQGSLVADNARSMLTVSMTFGDAELLEQMIWGVSAVLQNENQVLPQLGGQTAVVLPLDTPVINPISAGIRDQLDLPLRIILALGAGVGLALLFEYVDTTIHGRDELKETVGLPILGEIPKK